MELDSASSLKPERPASKVLQGEQPGLALAIVGQELLLAPDPDLAIEILRAERTAPAVGGALHRFHSSLRSPGEEARPDLACFLEFVMAIIDGAGTHPDLLDEAGQRDLGASVVAGLLEIDPNLFRLDRRVKAVADWNTVEIVQPTYRETDVEGAVHPRQAARQFRLFRGTVGQDIFKISKLTNLRVRAGARLLSQPPAQHMTADLEVIGLGPACIAMEDELAP